MKIHLAPTRFAGRRLAAVLICVIGSCSIAGADTDTPLEISMQHIKKAYKELSIDLQQPQDASKADYVTLATTLQTEGQKARTDAPKITNGMTPEQKDAMVKDYQKSMDGFLQSVTALIHDLQQSNWNDARAQLAALKKEMIDGHKAFRKKED